MPKKTELLKWVWTGTIIVFAVGLVAVTFIKGLSPTCYFNNYYQLFIVLALLAFFAEYIDSSLGMGYGTTLTPLLIIVGFQPLQVVTALLFSEFISGITAGILHHKADNVNFIKDTESRKVMLLMASCSIAGTLLAVAVALNLPKFYVRLYIGLMILAIGIFLILKSRTNYRFSWKRITAIGLLAAFNKGISGGGYGPLLTSGQLLSGIKEKNAVAITSMAEGLVCFVAVIIYFLSGTEFDWKLTIPLTLGAFISVPGAVLTVKIIPANFIRGQIAYVTLFLGILMVAKTILL
ncbi:MAG: sulfite exporter TauE/SafE family protein [Victivallales bacterium]